MKYFGGCDVGSTYTKAVILDENGKIVADTTIKSKINAEELELLRKLFQSFVFDILGLLDTEAGGDDGLVDGLMETIIDIRKEARAKKDWATSDIIRDKLASLDIVLKDGK